MQLPTMTKTKTNITSSKEADKDAGLNFLDIKVYIPFKNLVVSENLLNFPAIWRIGQYLGGFSHVG